MLYSTLVIFVDSIGFQGQRNPRLRKLVVAQVDFSREEAPRFQANEDL